MLRVLLGLLAFLLLLFGGVLVLGLILWWLYVRSSEEKEPEAIEIKLPVPASEHEEEVPAPEAAEEAPPQQPVEPDDLRRIEGIGPKISAVLQAAGIATFAQLAVTEVSRIEQILGDENPRLQRLVDPSTWPEQAGLAARGEWEALEALQQELKGGRRVSAA